METMIKRLVQLALLKHQTGNLDDYLDLTVRVEFMKKTPSCQLNCSAANRRYTNPPGDSIQIDVAKILLLRSK